MGDSCEKAGYSSLEMASSTKNCQVAGARSTLRQVGHCTMRSASLDQVLMAAEAQPKLHTSSSHPTFAPLSIASIDLMRCSLRQDKGVTYLSRRSKTSRQTRVPGGSQKVLINDTGGAIRRVCNVCARAMLVSCKHQDEEGKCYELC